MPSKQLVAKAKYTNRAIALEDLAGIRSQTKVRKTQRSRHSKWAFYQFRQFIEYKSALQGVQVILVDPRNTSRTCSHAVPADINAAINISKVAFNRPMVATTLLASA